jgi:beta-glucosidase
VDGRLPSVWDDLCRTPGAIKDGTSGDDAIDSYHLYEQDIDLLEAYGASHYRFSISWSRVIPLGGRNDPVNEKGIAYYNRLIDGLLARGIQPCVTIFHWDLPSELEKRYGGWTCQDEVTLDYERYSKLLFDRFGDRVKLWITLNEVSLETRCRTAFSTRNQINPLQPYCVGMFSSLGLKPNFSFEKHLYQ